MIRFPTMPPNRQMWSAEAQVNAPQGMMMTPEKLPPGSSFGGQMLGPPQGMGSPTDKLPMMGGALGGGKPMMTPGFGQMPQAPGGLQGFAPQRPPQGAMPGFGGMPGPQGMLPRGALPNAGTRGPMTSPQGFQGLGRFRGYQR